VRAELIAPAPDGALSPSVVVLSTTDLVRFAGASSDFNLIHYDREYANSRGFDGVIVHGFFKAALLSEFLLAQTPPGSWIKRLSATYRGVDNVGAPIAMHGRRIGTGPDAHLVSFELWTENPSGEVTTRCEATLRWGAEE
jgi:acyl dehydratase